jgi:hypothetical protein
MAAGAAALAQGHVSHGGASALDWNLIERAQHGEAAWVR